MKRVLFLLIWFVASSAMAQDVIVMRDGTSILSKVLEITSTDVKYKKHNNLEGPTYSVLKTAVLVINYANGEKESFGAPENAPTIIGNSTDPQSYSYEELDVFKKANSQRKKSKRIKTIGWTAGILLVGAGAATIAGDVDGEKIDLGLGLIVGGAAITTGCIIWGNMLKKKNALAINSAPIYQYDFLLKNGSTLSAGVDVLRNSHLNEKTLGLGIRYNF